MIYMTCSSLQDLKDRAAKKFALPSLQNVYRERQRVTRYEQLQEGDCVCITRTAYEDMGVLCDWIKQRQQQSSTSEVALRRDSPISCSPKPSNSSLAQASPKRRPKAKANTTDGDGSPEAPRAVSLDLRKLWDANGRVVAIDPQVELRRLRHVRSSIAEGWLFEQLQ
ncbi:TPA: hypothetical protein N0F65_000385 [Lagenidium giganteum]|uniref:Uncharacterized protein n=1 Tax=Lagenidium giganteum TaxID=4803 RepID=A0AAV2Z3D7_9STRA|nr:TPA: hypothetical protein N0F65_000385 [Lagenidium giganteum]